MLRLLFFFCLLMIGSLASAEQALCPHIHLLEGKLHLNANEKILVCGSSKGAEAWDEIPVPQAQLHLTTILQNKGYLSPRFERDGDELKVWQGPLSVTKELVVTGADGLLRPEKKRKILGDAIEPDKLSEVQSWADLGLRSQGHACPKIDLVAQGWDAKMVLTVDPGPEQRVTRLEATGLQGLREETLRRYQPFRLGDRYDVRETQIMTSRLLADGLFQSAYFLTECRADEVHLKLQTNVGDPRLLTFGVGASTEEFPFLDFGLRNARLDDRASSVTTTLHLSPVVQRLAVSSELYWLENFPTAFFGPRFQIERDDERSYLIETEKLGADLGRNWDFADVRATSRFGPTLNESRTLRGVGPADAKYLSLDGQLHLSSHVYEVFFRDQYEGWSSSLLYHGQRKGLGSEINADRYEINHKVLWNIGSFAPPLAVLATRFQGIFVDADQINEGRVRDLLPIDDRIYFGGDQNLRGFSRESLNNGGLGYLTALYLGFELRLIEEIPWHLQPFLLWDSARLGNSRMAVDGPLFFSEGGGLRWASPFGTLRGTAARGRIFHGDDTTATYAQQWVYFFSFGQEF